MKRGKWITVNGVRVYASVDPRTGQDTYRVVVGGITISVDTLREVQILTGGKKR